MSATAPPPPGWYADPWTHGLSRWWDGRAWTPHAQPLRPTADRPLAEPGSRLLARVIDTALLVVVLVPLWFGALALVLRQSLATQVSTTTTLDTLTVLRLPLLLLGFGLAALVLPVLYEVLMLRRDGQTVGKKVVGIRVVRLADGRPPSGGEALVRTLVYLALSGTYVDALWCLWDQPWRQCLHDKPVRTVVVPA